MSAAANSDYSELEFFISLKLINWSIKIICLDFVIEFCY